MLILLNLWVVKPVNKGDDKFVLMAPVKLNNPESVNYGFNAGLPLYYGGEGKAINSKASVKKSSGVVVKEQKKEKEPSAMDKVVKVEVEDKNKPAVLNMLVVKDEEKSEKQDGNVATSSVVDVKTSVDDGKVVKNSGDATMTATDKKVDSNKKDVAEPVVSQTDKNIDEAKKLLEVAENLAKSVANEDVKVEKKQKTVKVAEKSKQEVVVANIKNDLNEQSKKFADGVKTSSDAVKADVKAKNVEKLVNFSVNFDGGKENLKDTDVKKMEGVALKLAGQNDVNVKIVSYYSSIDDRNVAFSRLLNTRKVLLENNVPTSQIMIMVLEDKAKTNTVDVLFE